MADVSQGLPDAERVPLGDHLDELRSRLIRVLVFLGLATAAGLFFQDRLMALVVGPHLRVMASVTEHSRDPLVNDLQSMARAQEATGDRRGAETARLYRDLAARLSGSRLTVLRYQDAFLAYLKVALVCALLATGPVLLWQIWAFVSSGLYPRERRLVRFILPLSLGSFAVGVVLGYLVLVPWGLYFLAGYGDPALMVAGYTLDHYLGLFLNMTMVMGLVFQLPLAMLAADRTGVLPVARLRQGRRYALAVNVILAALLTPPDVVTQLIVAFVLSLLYEAGIVLCLLMRSRTGGPRSFVHPSASTADSRDVGQGPARGGDGA